ncbi:hypothetical protein BDN71DRAFT_1429081 [Pleurotus eryngii]|uniref:Uncharacterized protein n=1 Tax=Pleurotus eryngii TaxID=5323 RepID=A0A9P6A6R8_PLEER|nr:hypothetical protein BDN71DRAFT_1429081 [Pleurotus eryngii]
MVVAQVLQGLSPSVVWVVGLALLSECTPKEVIGRKCAKLLKTIVEDIVIVAFPDLVGRLLIIEPKSGSVECVEVSVAQITNDQTSAASIPMTSRSGQTTDIDSDSQEKASLDINSVAGCGIFIGQKRTGMGTPTCAIVVHTMVATHAHRPRTWHVYNLLRLRKLLCIRGGTHVTAELSAVSRGIRGVGFAHVYGAFNVAYGVGSTVGRIIGGQVYDHVKNYGWATICAFITCMLFVSLSLVFLWSGDLLLWKRLKNRLACWGQCHSLPQDK